MTHNAIMASWSLRGPIARGSRFRIIEDNGQLDLIADMSTPGRLLRAYRSIELNSPDEDIEGALDGLYADLGGLPALADAIKGRSFAEHLAQADE